MIYSLFGILVLAACGMQEEGSSSKTPSSYPESHAVTPYEQGVWYENLIMDETYSLEDALEEHPEKQDIFKGKIVFDELRTGAISEKFDIAVNAGESIKLTMICDDDSPWESTLSPLHKDFFAGGGRCSGVTGFETKPLSENLSEWNIDIHPEKNEMTYRVILEIKGDK